MKKIVLNEHQQVTLVAIRGDAKHQKVVILFHDYAPDCPPERKDLHKFEVVCTFDHFDPEMNEMDDEEKLALDKSKSVYVTTREHPTALASVEFDTSVWKQDGPIQKEAV